MRALGNVIGWCMWRVDGREAKVTRKNLQLCFPDMAEAQRESMVRNSLMQTGQSGLELIKVWMQDNERSAALIKRVVNSELFEDRLRSPKSLLLLVPHLGNWEIIALWCAKFEELTALYQPPKQVELEPIIRQARERMGNKLYPTDASGVRAILRVLKKGGFSGILPDQEPEPEGGVFAPFYGVPALTMTLAHGLISRTECEVVMAYGRRVKGGFEIVFQDVDPAIRAKDAVQSATARNKSVENCIDDCPEQYHWEYKRFKKQPEDTIRHYKF